MRLASAAFIAGCALAAAAWAGPVQPVLAEAKAQRGPFLDTLKALVEIESGSGDREGLDRISDLVASKLRGVADSVELVEPRVAELRRNGGKLRPGRMVRASLEGRGERRILLIAHMDTVYARGQSASQPFRIDGPRAYGLGIGDDKQGIALVIHTLAILKSLPRDAYGKVTVLVNGDEEIGSFASRDVITDLAAEQDATLSFEASDFATGSLSLATSGVGSISLRVRGVASHAGVSPGRGVNAIYELAHQVLQMRDLSDPARGIKVNWTLAQGGSTLNMIPPSAQATADVRVRRVEDFDVVEQEVRSRIANRLLPESSVEVSFARGRPPLAPTPAALALARHAQSIAAEIGGKIGVFTQAGGGGTDAAYAALKARGPVIEGMGLPSFGSHSASNEYVSLDAIEPRLYLAARVIMDISRDKVAY